MPKSDLPRIAILGAGPIGLEAALYARSLNLPVDIYERGRIGDYWQRWGHVRLFSPFGMNSTPLGRAAIRADHPEHEFPADDDCITGREHRNAYLEPLAKLETIKNCLRTGDAGAGHRPAWLSQGRWAGRSEARPAAVSPAGPRQPRRRNASRRPTSCSTAPAPIGQHRWLGDGGIPAVGETAAEQQHRLRPRRRPAATGRTLYAGKTIAGRRRRLLGGDDGLQPGRAGARRHPGPGSSGWRAAPARSRSRASPTTRCANATAWPCRPTRWPRAATATSSFTPGSVIDARRVPRAGQGLPRRRHASPARPRPGRSIASSPTSATRRTRASTASCRSTSATPRSAR